MIYSKDIKSYLNSHYLTEGVRITCGILFPAFVFGYFDRLQVGIIVSLGALLVSVTDSPGPIHHRKNGMAAAAASITITTLVAGMVSTSPLWLLVSLALFCFLFSMIAVFGARASSIGISSLIAFTLSIDPQHQLTTPDAILHYSFLVAIGAIWYMSYSLLMYRFSPYRLPRQALGDSIQATAEYLRLRADLYSKEVDYKAAYDKILHQQALVQQKQNELSELLLKTRGSIKESTKIGRTLVMMHFDVTDIFEKIMMSHQQYQDLHKAFDTTGILDEYRLMLLHLADELDSIGLAVKSGERTKSDKQFVRQVGVVRNHLDQLREQQLNPSNIEGFIGLRRILENIQDLADRLNILHRYTAYDEAFAKRPLRKEVLEKMITSQRIDPALLFSNLNLKSETFRHALRLTIAVVVGHIIAHIFAIGHAYWILLTIVVIVKPAYSLSKTRNKDRLFGTILGVAIGVVIISLVHNSTAILLCMVALMIGSYSNMRSNYFLSVLLMTPYLVLFYHILNPKDFTDLLKYRVLDTAIGSVIGFAAAFIFPSWERDKIKPLAIEMLTQVRNYFLLSEYLLTNATQGHAHRQVARRHAFIALANLSDAFSRMVAEPGSNQDITNRLHQFVVLNHTFTSYVATLLDYIQEHKQEIDQQELSPALAEIGAMLDAAIQALQHPQTDPVTYEKTALRRLNQNAEALLAKRSVELQQGLVESPTRQQLLAYKSLTDQVNLVYNVASDINKVAKGLFSN